MFVVFLPHTRAAILVLLPSHLRASCHGACCYPATFGDLFRNSRAVTLFLRDSGCGNIVHLSPVTYAVILVLLSFHLYLAHSMNLCCYCVISRVAFFDTCDVTLPGGDR